MSDEIVEEVHAARRKIAEACDYDFKKMGERFIDLQQKHPERLVAVVRKAETGATSPE